MTKVDRYDFRSKHHGTEVVVKSREGKWVKASDYDALTAERDALIRDRDRWAEEAQASTSPIVAGLTADNARLRDALTALVDEYCDYMTINHLGDPEKQHNIKRARAALTEEETK